MTTNAGRPDYDATIRDPLLHAGEPSFRLRAQDELAADAGRDWARRAFDAGVDVALVEAALQQADRLEAWPNRKLPDASHIPEAELKHLRYQFSRRAWNDAHPVPSLKDVFAVQRAADETSAADREAARLALQATCKHAAYSFGAHGRLCPDCGAAMMEAA